MRRHQPSRKKVRRVRRLEARRPVLVSARPNAPNMWQMTYAVSLRVEGLLDVKRPPVTGVGEDGLAAASRQVQVELRLPRRMMFPFEKLGEGWRGAQVMRSYTATTRSRYVCLLGGSLVIRQRLICSSVAARKRATSDFPAPRAAILTPRTWVSSISARPSRSA